MNFLRKRRCAVEIHRLLSFNFFFFIFRIPNTEYISVSYLSRNRFANGRQPIRSAPSPKAQCVPWGLLSLAARRALIGPGSRGRDIETKARAAAAAELFF